jgi:hypothetical protein
MGTAAVQCKGNVGGTLELSGAPCRIIRHCRDSALPPHPHATGPFRKNA